MKIYRKHIASLFVCLLAANFAFAQSGIDHQVFILGNFADASEQHNFMEFLENALWQAGGDFTLVLNGDLVNQKIGKNDHDDLLENIFAVAELVENFPKGLLLLVPGDRDWNASKRGGEKSLGHLEDRVKDFLKEKKYKRCKWAVGKGCPGPEVYEVSNGLTILALNTQWWNHPYDKPRPTDVICDGLSEENLKEGLVDAVEDFRDRNVLIVGHHPVHSLGNYGGYFSVGDWFKPFPGIGMFRTAFHANAGDQYDLANERLHHFSQSIINLLYFHNHLIYASGHEHNQQVVQGGGNYLVNSGAPASARYVASDEITVFSKKAAGLMLLTYQANGAVSTTFLENTGQGNVAGTTEIPLFSSACTESPSVTEPSKFGHDVIVNTAYVPCYTTAQATLKMARKYNETVEIPAGAEYEAGWWKRLWFGSHYRTTWTQPVKVNYLDLDDTFGGLTIYKKGGGRQTTSLKFRSGDGTVYTFRSVNKDPAKALNYKLTNTIAKSVIRDQTSTQQPYGALVVAPLLDKIDILHADPVLYRLPDDPKLGPFQEKYGGLFGMLEENPGKKNKAGEHFGDADRIDQSTQMFKRFFRDQDTELDTDEFVRARLFDILVGDWSKHEDNWKWAAYKIPGGYRYRPIPRDRDHVFSMQDGIINWLADRPFGIQNLEHFGYDVPNVKSVTFQARHMDRFLLSEVPKSVFVEQTKFIQENISEADIENAVRQMPPEVLDLSGRTIERKLKRRIQDLPKAMERYYELLSREIDVVGSKDEEFFEIQHREDGSLHVQVYDTHGKDRGAQLLYDRVFFPSETKEVRLWGLNNDDVFSASGEGNGAIKVRAFGGPGDDLFLDRATTAQTLFYDKGQGTEYQIKGQAKTVTHWNRELYEYDRTRFEYDYFLPLIYLGYTNYTGLGFNLGGNWTVRRFPKDDYHSKHSFGFGLTTKGNASASYSGRFHQTIRRWDFLVDVYLENPRLQNRFYGQGNGSVNNDDELGVDFYQSAVNTQHGSIGLVRDFWQHSSFQVMAGLERNESQEILGTFLSQSSEDIFGTDVDLLTIPANMTLDFDFRDEKGLPYRGARAVFAYHYHHMLTDEPGATNYGIANADIEYYLSTHRKNPLTLGLRIGGATSHGQLPWYDLPSLGTTNGLRGFVENRFAGEHSAYFNAELRYQLFRKQTSLVPVKAGVKVFYDYGRVFLEGWDEGIGFRDGYGFGFYLVPLDERLTLSLSFGFSDEESMYPVFGVGRPLR